MKARKGNRIKPLRDMVQEHETQLPAHKRPLPIFRPPTEELPPQPSRAAEGLETVIFDPQQELQAKIDDVTKSINSLTVEERAAKHAEANVLENLEELLENEATMASVLAATLPAAISGPQTSPPVPDSATAAVNLEFDFSDQKEFLDEIEREQGQSVESLIAAHTQKKTATGTARPAGTSAADAADLEAYLDRAAHNSDGSSNPHSGSR